MLDVLIRSGNVIDGAGNPWIRADVGIADGRIVAVGKLTDELARRTIDADGLCVCPGFIDMHTHSDLQLLAQPEWHVKLAQGVTLEVIGQDGLGLAPLTDNVIGILRQQLKAWNGDPPEIAWTWRTVAEYLARFDGHVAPNVAFLAPHGTVRMQVMGVDNRAPTDVELGAMQALVAQAMRDGAVGLSAGLTYAPAVYSDDDELVALCEPVRQFGGYYAPHHRNYGAGALDAYAASIDIGRRAGVAVHLTHAHMSTPANRGRASELLALVDAARADGVDTTLDTYPYLAGNSYLHASLPSWVHEGGNAAILARLDDPDVRERIRSQMEGEGSSTGPVDWTQTFLTTASRPENRRFVGLSVADAALAAQAPTAFDFYCDLLVAEDLGVGAITFAGNEENVRRILQHPAHMAGSDGIVVGERPHPRAWGTFARYLSEYTRELKLVRLEEMVRKMTSLPAQRLGLFDRGLVRPGAAADVVCFDASRIRDTATYADPRRAPEGVPFVLVNGEIVIDGARHTGALPGRALRRPARV
ncbi:MAG TPA: D-aminoacylase [Chloroflexota bacterium]|nr:D-aminoacylase [Chloroflexota bacterium]